MVLGKLLHQWLILTVEIDLLMFGRIISLQSYLYAVVLTTIFSLVVNLAAPPKAEKAGYGGVAEDSGMNSSSAAHRAALLLAPKGKALLGQKACSLLRILSCNPRKDAV